MIKYKSEEEIEIIRIGASILSKLLGMISKEIKFGVKTIFLDTLIEEFIRDNGAKPSFKGYRGYQYSSCISVNDQVVHALPGKYELKEGDICSIDCGVYYKGYHSDSAFTYFVGEIEKYIFDFLKTTRESLNIAIESIRINCRTGDIGSIIQNHIESHGYSVVKDLVGHGIGRDLHEEPDFPNFGAKGSGSKITNGMVFAIEPMTTMGKSTLVCDRDRWTLKTFDGSLSAHFEHTIGVLNNKVEVLTTFDYIDDEKYSSVT